MPSTQFICLKIWSNFFAFISRRLAFYSRLAPDFPNQPYSYKHIYHRWITWLEHRIIEFMKVWILNLYLLLFPLLPFLSSSLSLMFLTLHPHRLQTWESRSWLLKLPSNSINSIRWIFQVLKNLSCGMTSSSSLKMVYFLTLTCFLDFMVHKHLAIFIWNHFGKGAFQLLAAWPFVILECWCNSHAMPISC